MEDSGNTFNNFSGAVFVLTSSEAIDSNDSLHLSCFPMVVVVVVLLILQTRHLFQS